VTQASAATRLRAVAAQPTSRARWYRIVMVTAELNPGNEMVLSDESPTSPCGVTFEDDGETGYFYALDLGRRSGDNQIVDALHLYDANQVVDRDRPSMVSILWSSDGMKSCLLINRYPHAVFDFSGRRGYSRNNYPITPSPEDTSWLTSNHEWDDAALQGFDLSATR